jgi:hypothetical protein
MGHLFRFKVAGEIRKMFLLFLRYTHNNEDPMKDTLCLTKLPVTDTQTQVYFNLKNLSTIERSHILTMR